MIRSKKGRQGVNAVGNNSYSSSTAGRGKAILDFIEGSEPTTYIEGKDGKFKKKVVESKDLTKTIRLSTLEGLYSKHMGLSAREFMKIVREHFKNIK